jgi:hypothetical protein
MDFIKKTIADGELGMIFANDGRIGRMRATKGRS